MNFKLTTECGYRWRWEQNYYWKFGGRVLDVNGEKIGVAFGPVMFFGKFS